MQARERVVRVVELSVINGAKIVLDVAPRERSAAQDDGHVEPPLLHELEVLLHDQRRFHEQAAHADRVGLVLFVRVQDRLDGLLDAEVDDLVAVVREDDVDEVLADVVDVALHGREHHRALLAALDLLHVRLEELHRGLHYFRRLQHERQLHLSAAEQVADRLHAVEQDVVDDRERRVGLERSRERFVETELLAVNDVQLQALLDGQICVLRLAALDRRALEECRQLTKRIVGADLAVEFPSIEDEVFADRELALADPRKRLDLAGVDDRRVEAGVDRRVQEHRIERDASDCAQAERDVRDAEDRVDRWELLLDSPEGLDRLGGVAAVLLDAG